jgi:hypothetical protein
MRWWVLLAVVVGGCVVEASECDELETQRSCERAKAESGECRWLEVRAPVVEADGTCRADAPSHGECIGVSADTSQGCVGVQCEGESAGPVFWQTDGDRVETMVSPFCGGRIFTGEWEACGVADESPAACACACES